MQNIRVDAFCYLIVAILFLAPFSYADGNATNLSKPCDVHDASPQCGRNERCFSPSENKDSECVCMRGYKRVMEDCVEILTTTTASTINVQADSKANSGGSSVVAGLLISTLLVLIGVLVYIGVTRYEWLHEFRQFRQNRYGNVLVTRDDDDDDDPPIA